RNFMGASQQQVGHQRMVPYRFAIFPDLAVRTFSNPAIQLELAGDNRLGEITFADEIGDEINLANRFWIEQKERIAQTRFLLPKGAVNLGKKLPTPNFSPMRQRGRDRIRIHGRAMPDNQERAVRS